MSEEMEAVAAAAIGGLAKDTTGDGYLNGPCPNCQTELKGPFCSRCGQSAKDMQKPFLTLFFDVLTDVFSLDGRLWRTLPALIFRPGHVTRSYLNGKRARYVPPFRLFLLASIVFFLVIFGLVQKQDWMNNDEPIFGAGRDSIAAIPLENSTLGEQEGFSEIFDENGEFDRAAAEAFLDNLPAEARMSSPEARENLFRLVDISASRTEIFNAIQKWAPRLSFLLLPFYVIILALMHFWHRRIYLYDHMIVALHVQTFLYLSVTLIMLLGLWMPGVTGLLWMVWTIAFPYHLYKTLRKSYATYRLTTFLRTFIFIFSSFIALLILVVVTSLLGANEAGLFTWEQLTSSDEPLEQAPIPVE